MRPNSTSAFHPLLLGTLLATSGCSTVAEKTTVLSDEKILSETSGVLGYAPSDMTLISRRIDGLSTYTVVKAKDGKQFACVVDGGNLLSFGMSNPPKCNKKE